MVVAGSNKRDRDGLFDWEPPLTENEQKVFAVLGKEELSIDGVIRQCGLPASATSVALFSLEMKRLIRQLPGKMFVRDS